MPTYDQLPQATSVGTADLIAIEQNGTTESATVGLLLASTQPALTLASGSLLGRMSAGSGGPEAIGLGSGLSFSGGQLVASPGTLQLNSPAFTGTPTAPTPALTDSSTTLATTAFVRSVAQTQTVSLTGDIRGSGVGAITTTLPAIVTPGVYGLVTVNAKGQVISGGTLTPANINGLAAVASTGRFASLSGPFGTVDVSAATVTTPAGGVARSLASRASDVFNVLDFGAVADGVTGAGAAINAAIAAASALPAGGEVFIPAGRYRLDLLQAAILARSNVVLRGAGMGRSVLLIDDTVSGGPGGAAISNATAPGVAPALSDFHLTGLTLQGMRALDGSNVSPTGAFLVNLTNITTVTVTDCEFLDSRSFSLGLFSGSDVTVQGCRVMRSNVDSIAVWDVSDATIVDNDIQMSGDDSISVHTNDATPPPLRSGVLIADNTITDGPGIHVLGAKNTTISNNVIRRSRAAGINVTFDPYFHQGNTPIFAIQITGNLIEDVIDNSGFIPGSTPGYYIFLGGSSKQAGNGASVPGIPVPGSGNVTPLYGTGTGNFYGNAQSNNDGSHTVTGTTASPGGYWIRVEDNTLVRTLPAVAAWSQWGYGAALQVGVSGVYTGAITEAMLNHPGIHLAAALRDSRVAGNIIQTTGANGIEFDYVVNDLDYDGLEIANNRIADFGLFGIFWPTSVVSNQRIRMIGNDFDGDPYFRSSGRGPNGSWSGTGNPSFAIYAAFLSGAEIVENHFRNVAAPVATGGGGQVAYRGNVVHCNPVATGFSTANQGVGNVPAAAADFTHVIEVCDPTDANYGRLRSVTLMQAPAQPTTGTYVTGHFVAATQPAYVNGQLALGWKRLTTGSTHVSGTDWGQVFGAGTAPPVAALLGGTGNGFSAVSVGGLLALSGGVLSGTGLPLPSVTTTYTASGAIAPTDNVALVNATTNVVMTLAAATADGHELTVKRYGAGTVSVTATIDGKAATVVVMNSATIKESLTLAWSQALSTWLMI